jgi:hypothetical protein
MSIPVIIEFSKQQATNNKQQSFLVRCAVRNNKKQKKVKKKIKQNHKPGGNINFCTPPT